MSYTWKHAVLYIRLRSESLRIYNPLCQCHEAMKATNTISNKVIS